MNTLVDLIKLAGEPPSSSLQGTTSPLTRYSPWFRFEEGGVVP